jgi:hypothetical protein
MSFLALPAFVQPPLTPGESGDRPMRMPDGRDQREMILKDEHEKSLKDAAQMQKLTEEVRAELEKNDRHVLSIGTLKKLDEIEKIVKRMRGRMKHL